MAFNRLVAQVGNLVSNDAEVDDSMPCKPDILGLRACVKGSSKEECEGLRLDLMRCMAQFNVDATENVRAQIGIAKYHEYVKDLEEKHGKEKASEIIAEPVEKLKTVEAAQMVHRVRNNQHPKGAPQTELEKAQWSNADQVRLEMGEKAWWDSVRVVGAEFGAENADRLFGLRKEADAMSKAVERLAPGVNMQENSVKSLEKFKEIMEPVREAAPNATSVEDLTAAFKKVYRSDSSLQAKLN